MLINIDYRNRLAIYLQIVNEIERLVTLEIVKPNEQIPSIRDMACTLGINPNTVKKAYDILEAKGIIVMKSTKGTFISDHAQNAKKIKIEELVEEVKNKMKELENLGLSKEEIIKRVK